MIELVHWGEDRQVECSACLDKGKHSAEFKVGDAVMALYPYAALGAWVTDPRTGTALAGPFFCAACGTEYQHGKFTFRVMNPPRMGGLIVGPPAAS